MKAAGFFQHGGSEVIVPVELPHPIPEADDVVVRMHAAGLNFADIYRRRGEYEVDGPSPFVLGMEGAGVIHAVGSNVKSFAVGDRVGFAHVPRANAEYVRAPAWKVIPLPDDISFETAASILLQGMTAHYLTHDSYAVQPRDVVLVHSASGGVGLLLVQISKMLGARVIGTVSSADKAYSARDAGADHVIVRSEGDWKAAVLEFTHGKGVDVAYDAIGTTLEETLSIVRPRGTAVYFGWAGGAPPRIDPGILMNDSKRLVGGDLWSHVSDRQSLLQRSDALFTWLREGNIRSQVSATFRLSEASAAHRHLEGGTTTGKLLLISE